MKLVSVKRTEAEKKAEQKKYDKPSTLAGDEYPYNTRICLEKRVLDKLGISPKDFKVGQTVTLEAICSVKSLKMVDGKDYDTSEIELQIQQIGVEKKSGSLKEAVESAMKETEND